MPEKHRVSKSRRTDGDITDLQWDFLHDQIATDDPRRTAQEHRWALYELTTNRKVGQISARPCAELWARHGPQILAWWITEHPGTRPSCWWRFLEDADGMAASVPPLLQQPKRLARLGVLTAAEREALTIGEPRGSA